MTGRNVIPFGTPAARDAAAHDGEAAILDMQAERDARAGAAFADYAKLKLRADQTLLILDMLAAGRAWERFIRTALPDPRQQKGLL